LLGPALASTSSQEERLEAITSAKQVARYLVENVLQGVPKSDSEAAYRKLALVSTYTTITHFLTLPSSIDFLCILSNLLSRRSFVKPSELRFTPHTALGDNESIKSISPAPSLDEIKSTMNKGNQPKNTRKRKQRSKDASASSSTNEGNTACGSAASST